MQTGSNPTLDANAQHPPEIRSSDPRHLGNLTKKMNAINSHASNNLFQVHISLLDSIHMDQIKFIYF